MSTSNYSYMVVVLDFNGQELNVVTEEFQDANELTDASISFSSYEQAQAFYERCKLKFPNCSVKILPRTM